MNSGNNQSHSVDQIGNIDMDTAGNVNSDAMLNELSNECVEVGH